MESKNLHLVLIAILLISLPLLVHAQEQTVENAQKFLSMTLPGNGYMAGSLRSAFKKTVDIANRKGQGYVEYSIGGEAKIVDADAVSRCTSKILSDYSGVTVNYVVKRSYYGSVVSRRTDKLTEALSKTFSQSTIIGRPDGFSWSEIKFVRSDGGNVDLLFSENEIASTIYLRSEDLAKRVAFAMEFLRISCDKSAGTGF